MEEKINGEQMEDNHNLSPEMEQLLKDESAEAEVAAAVDAAAEEGMIITREEAVKIMVAKRQELSDNPQL